MPKLFLSFALPLHSIKTYIAIVLMYNTPRYLSFFFFLKGEREFLLQTRAFVKRKKIKLEFRSVTH